MQRGENSRCVANTPRIPGDNVIVSTSQIAQELTESEDKVDTGSTRTTFGTSEQRVSKDRSLGKGRGGRTWVGKEGTLPG